MKIEVIKQDITCLDENVECIVNAANETLLGGGGVDGAIHDKAGPGLVEECATLGGCLPGEAKASKAYRLKQKYIIHTVGPRYGHADHPEEILEACYKNSLKLADALGCKVIAFPSIATGIFGFPIDKAAAICAKTVNQYQPKSLQKAYLCVLPGENENFKAYSREFSKYTNS